MKTFAASLAAALCAAALCPLSAFAAETLRVGGGSAPMENVFKRIKEPFLKKTGIELELHEIGPVDAYIELVNDRLDVASAGLGSLMQWQEMVRKTGKTGAKEPDDLIWHIVGNDYITVYTNKDVSLSELTTEQVRGIFTGEITDWNEVGGDGPIVVVLGYNVQGLMSEFQRKVLAGADFTQDVVYVNTAEEMKRTVRLTPGAITIGTLAQTLDDSINVIAYPAPARHISMLWRFNSPKRPQTHMLYEYLRSPEALKFVLTQKMERDKK